MLKSMAFAIPALLLPIGAAAQASFTVTGIGVLPGYTDSLGFAINDSGQVAGTLQNGLTEGVIDHAFLYSGGTLVDLGILPGGTHTDGFAINNCGQVLASGDDSLNSAVIVLYTGGTLVDLGAPPPPAPSSILLQGAGGINDAGEILGDADLTGSPFTNFASLYNGGSGWVDLSVPAKYSGIYGFAINKSGEVAGGGTLAAAPNNTHAVTYKSGVWTDLGTVPGLSESGAAALNNLGDVAGSVGNATGTVDHIMLYRGGVMTDLGVLPGDIGADGYGINDFDEVVGDSFSDSNDRAAYYSVTTGLADLNTMIPPASGWQLTQALGINQHGQITGWGSYQGVGQAFLLNPIPTLSLINSVNALIPQLVCQICQGVLTDLIQPIPPDLTDLTERRKAELQDDVLVLIFAVSVFVAQDQIAPDAGELVIHQSRELLDALRGPKVILPPPHSGCGS